MLEVGAHFDFCNPAEWRQPWGRRYNEILDLISWIDASTDISAVTISEHHFLDDGYLPGVMPIAAAIAARTERVRIGTNILILPLHHPLRVAEDALTVDALSQGRFRLGVGNGYREQEFRVFGVPLADRPARVEEGIEIIRRALTGRPFAFEGHHWSFDEVRVRPGPVDETGPPIWMGGAVDAVLDRAARLADGFLGTTTDQIVFYHEACDRHGVSAEDRRACCTIMAVVDEDPERALSELQDHLLYQANQYVDYGFLPGGHFEDVAAVVEMNFFPFLDASAAISLLRGVESAGGAEVQLPALLPGEPIVSGQRRLEYISDRVVPALQVVPSGADSPIP